MTQINRIKIQKPDPTFKGEEKTRIRNRVLGPILSDPGIWAGLRNKGQTVYMTAQTHLS